MSSCAGMTQKGHCHSQAQPVGGGEESVLGISGLHATVTPRPIPLIPAGLRRSFRLGRRERLGSSQEGKTPTVVESPELLTYEEVTRYQQRPGERPRLVVLIGRSLGLSVQGRTVPPCGGTVECSGGARWGTASSPFVSQGRWEPGCTS